MQLYPRLRAGTVAKGRAWLRRGSDDDADTNEPTFSRHLEAVFRQSCTVFEADYSSLLVVTWDRWMHGREVGYFASLGLIMSSQDRA